MCYSYGACSVHPENSFLLFTIHPPRSMLDLLPPEIREIIAMYSDSVRMCKLCKRPRCLENMLCWRCWQGTAKMSLEEWQRMIRLPEVDPRPCIMKKPYTTSYLS
jgi:hypothetical protein